MILKRRYYLTDIINQNDSYDRKETGKTKG